MRARVSSRPSTTASSMPPPGLNCLPNGHTQRVQKPAVLYPQLFYLRKEGGMDGLLVPLRQVFQNGQEAVSASLAVSGVVFIFLLVNSSMS